MISPLPLLQNVRVASPCDASWDEMNSIEGDRVKYCGQCAKNVYNLSAMSQAEAEGLLRAHEGRLCVRYYQRRDGTILTSDCPIGMHAVRLRLVRDSVAAALMVLVLGAMLAPGMTRTQGVMAHPPTEKPVPQPPKTVPEPTIRVKVGETAIRMGRIAAPRHVHTIVGHIPRPEVSAQAVSLVPDQPRDYDSTDEAILKPRTENMAKK